MLEGSPHLRASEMDAVWQFMDNSQKRHQHVGRAAATTSRACTAPSWARASAAIFSAGSDYHHPLHQLRPAQRARTSPTRSRPPALEAFDADRSATREYYGVAPFDGEERFRYLQALEVDESCLECHGEPVGEIDITGHAKEGWTLDSVGGAISIVIPMDQQNQAMMGNVMRDVAFFLMLTVLIGAVIYLVTTFFVFRPIDRMKVAFGEMGEGRLGVLLDDRRASKEVASLIARFNDMAAELRAMYEHLEDQVASRTHDLQEANAALERQRDDLEEFEAAELAKEARFKSDLLSMVNHELRTPLTSIITFAQISKEACSVQGDPLRAADRHAWEEIEKNSLILLEMINNMLDIARSDAGSMRATCEPMDLGDVVASVKSTMTPLARKYAVSFGTRIDSDVPLVNGDYEKTQRILENLASNAIKFTPDGGSVRLRVERDAGTGDVVMRMTDTGIGIADEDKERIFERFFQVDSTSTRKYNGSGLGLALVREYAAIQGFEVSVESTFGKGSTFVVRIPAAATVGEEG